MRNLNKLLLSGASTIIHSLAVPMFFLVFIVYYKPYGVYNILQMDNASFAFNVSILFCIVLVSVSITRGWLYLIGKYRDVTRTAYLLWCVTEIIVASLFSSLYIVLISDVKLLFFDIVGSAVLMMEATGVFPYGFLWLVFELYSRDNDAAAASDDTSLIRFYDEYKKLRLVIAPEAVVYIRSEDNYVQIHYLDQGKAHKFILRSSMRALEDMLTKRGLLRCHRSYFINPEYIKIVRRDGAGLVVAELKPEGFESIPISRKYQAEVSEHL